LDLAQHLSWPVFAEAASNVRFGSPDDGVLSCYEALIRSEAITDLKPSSFLRFGRSAMPRAVSEWLLEVAAGRMTTVGVGVEIHDPDELATHHVRAQPMDYAAAALRELPVRASGDWALRWMRREAKARTILDAELEKSWWEGAIASALCESLSSGDVLHVANSMPIRDVDAFAASRGPRIDVFANRGLGGIDGSLATAAGELAGRPERCLAVLVGDLAFLYDASSLTLLREKRATVLVVDNVGGGIFGFLPMSKGDDVSEELVFTPPSVDPADIARGYGAQVDVVETMKQLRQALSKALARNGLNVIVARVSREENIAIHGKVWDDLAKKMGRFS
jgi:2-succinyl-5-enolpyruvyl-6-hydroxy-3-cyclohexene-1-carboxylate synthase